MLDEFDKVEMNVENDLDVETKKESFCETKIEVSTLKVEDEKSLKDVEKESREEAKDNVKTFAKSQKPKKSLKKRIIAWLLGAGIFAGAVYGTKTLVDYQTTGNGGYQNMIKQNYELVDEALTQRLSRDTKFGTFNKSKITGLEFEQPGDENVVLNVYCELEERLITGSIVNHYGKGIYTVLLDYYNALVDAEKENNMLTYLDALKQIVENMQYVEFSTNNKIDFKWDNFNQNDANKINELFSFDLNKNQIGFLPYHFEIVDWKYDLNSHTFDYTYKLTGVSYCEEDSESYDEILKDDRLIMSSLSSKNVKAYNRVLTITTTSTNDMGAQIPIILQDLKDYISGKKTDFVVKTLTCEELSFDEMKEFNKMKRGDFDFKKPENLDLNNIR